VLAKVLGVPLEKVYTKNIAPRGHAVAVDNLINYADAVAEGALSPGDKVAWFVTGFGAHWSALVLEV
jgi:3-oxoacyl-[acyl-carrier-protein] synthase-3